MSVDILMPALSPTMEEGTLTKWLVKEGDTVSSGDVIAEIETDKATMEVEAVDEGVVEKLLVPEGTEGVKVNAVIARLNGDSGSASPAPSPKPEAAAAEAKAPEAASGDPEKAPAEARKPEPEGEGPTAIIPRPGAGRSRDPGGDEARQDHRPRRPAGRHGRGDAARSRRVPDGRGSRPVPGRLQGQPRPAPEFGERRVIDTPITEHGFAGLGVGAANGGAEADHRVHDLQLRHAGHRPDHQFGGQDALYVRRPDQMLGGVPRPQRPGRPRGRPAQPGLLLLVRPRAGAEGRGAL